MSDILSAQHMLEIIMLIITIRQRQQNEQPWVIREGTEESKRIEVE